MDEPPRERRDTKEILQQADVTVILANGDPVTGKLVDLKAGGLAVALPGKSPPEEGRTLRLTIGHAGLGRVEVRAIALESTPSSDGHTCRFRVTHVSAMDSSMPPDLYEVLNRRELFRVRPAQEQPVTARLAVPSDEELEWFVVTVTDLSGGGLGLMVDDALAEKFALVSRLEIELVLPDEEQPVRVIGRICYRLRLGRRQRLGIEFDARRTKFFPRVQSRIMQFHTRRQRELLKRPVGRLKL